MRPHFLSRCLAFLSYISAHAQTIPAHAEGLSEKEVEVFIDGGLQRGVLSQRKDQLTPAKLVLRPAYPSAVRP